MSKTLYRKYRSKSLNEVIGQSHITSILAKAIEQGKITHAYLFTGPRGVGKTSVARILAHQINQLPYTDETTHLDIIEIDAASNNSVEDIRDLRDKVQIAPVSAQKKIYIIDEVHMLSKSAFNALLKTLEEPPEHIVFILATTDADKLPATIVSRTQQFSFRPIGLTDIVDHLRFIAQSEKIAISDDALRLIAERGEGSFRDSISLLDQLTGLSDDQSEITASSVEDILGMAPKKLIESLVESIESNDQKHTLELLNQASDKGIDSILLAKQLAQDIRRNLANKIHLIDLLDKLLEVPKSSQPDIKLITVLLSNSGQHQPPKSVALAAPVYEVKASVAKLEKQVEIEAPSKPEPIKQKVKKPKSAPVDFSWNSFLDHISKLCFALHSVLQKCNYNLSDDKLTIYTGNAFYKKKLDDTKYKTILHTGLNEIGAEGLDIETIPTPAPPKSSQVAAIAAIMGGGEEVKVEV